MGQVPDALETVRAALDGLARALEEGRADAVLAAEAPLASAVHRLASLDRQAVAGTDRERLAEAVRAVRQSVARCVRLGAASGDLIRVVFPKAEYGREGTRPAESPFRPSLVSRG